MISFQSRKSRGSFGRRPSLHHLESLEPRLLLASDAMVPAVMGTVYQDLNGDGQPSAGEDIASATVLLYEDNGDGVLDIDQDTLFGEVQTSETGQYCFGSLDPDTTYFVMRPAQTVGGSDLSEIISGPVRPGEPTAPIDEFLTRQIVVAQPPSPSSVESSLVGNEIEMIGGERDLWVELSDGDTELALRVNPFGLDDVLVFDSAAGAIGRRTITWDGIDGSGTELAMGLNDIDLTDGGNNTGIMLRAGRDRQETTMTVRIYEGSDSNFSQTTLELPITGGEPDGFLFVSFSDFDGPVSPTRVDAIQMIIESTDRSVDGTIDVIGLTGVKVVNITETTEADLTITKSNGVDALVAGQPVTYEVVVRNLGPDDVTGATVFDPVPGSLENVAFTSVASGGATGNSETGGNEINDRVDLPSGSRIVYTIQGTVRENAIGSISNTARVLVPEGVIDRDLSNNSANDSDEIGTGIDLRIFKDNGVRTVSPGQELTYTITAFNLGPGTVQDAVVEDIFPGTLTNVEYTAAGTAGTSGFTEAGTGDINDLVTIPEGGEITYTVTAVVGEDIGGTLANLASITPPPGFVDVRPEDNVEIDTDIASRDASDLAVTKTNSLDVLIPGETVTYTVVVTNLGPANAGRVTIFDEIPEQLVNTTYTSEVINGEADGNTESGSDDIDDFVNINVGASIVYTLTGTVSSNAVGTLRNQAEVSSRSDPNPENNIAVDLDTLQPTADLSITITDNQTTVQPNDLLTYAIVVTNAGPSDAVGALVANLMPSALEDVSYTSVANGGASGNSDGIGDISDTVNVPAGGSIVYTVTGRVAATADGELVSTATVAAPGSVVETDLNNNVSVDVNTIVRQDVDVAIDKRRDTLEVIPGRPVRYQIRVSNVGGSPVENVAVVDELPDEIVEARFESIASDGASGNTPQGSGNINDFLSLDVGASVVYTLVGTVRSDVTGLIENVASIDAPGDINPNNDRASDTASLTPMADLSVTKTDGQVVTALGAILNYDITVTNHGPSDVVGASVDDLIPSGLSDTTYESVAAGGASGNTSGTGDIQDTVNLPTGSSITYSLRGTVGFETSGVIFNQVSVRGPEGVQELDQDNNVASDTTSISSVIGLGSNDNVSRRDSIVGEGDSDIFRWTAHDTGKLIANIWFENEIGDLDLEITDQRGNRIVVSDSTTDDNERMVIPVVSQQTYFVRVYGKGEAVNIYDLELENFPAPTANVIRIAPNDDSGMMNDDGVTFIELPRMLINADLADFVDMGIPILSPVLPDPDLLPVLPDGPGAAVEIVIRGTDGSEIVGFATPVDQSDTLFDFVPTNPLPEGDLLVSAAVRIFDGRLGGNRQPDPASGRSQLSDPYWLVIDVTPPQTADKPDLLRASDSGMSDSDDVTRKMQPAFTGFAEPGNKVLLRGNREGLGLSEIIGQSVATTDGRWEITVEPLVDGVHHIRAVYEDLAGNFSGLGEPILIEVDTIPPNTPFLDLINDTGMSHEDNVTNNSQLTFGMTTQDPRQDQHISRFNYKFRLFVRQDARGDNPGEILIYDSVVDGEIPIDNLLDGLTDIDTLQRTMPELPDGVHNFKLEVEDRAGNISHDFLLDVKIDTQPPPASIDLIESSDTGMLDDDRVTNKMQPAFSGNSEVGSKVEILANGRLVGEGFVRTDVSDGIPDDGFGEWEVTVEPLADGRYDMVARITDLAGNSNSSESIEIWIDTQKPNIPLLDLITDTGISDLDNITSDTTPTVTLTAGATIDGGRNEFPNDIKFRIYDRPGDGAGEVLLIDSFGALRDFTTNGFFTETLPELAHGPHNIKVEIEDRAGNISDPFLLDIVIDAEIPEVTARMIESSDTGMFNDDFVTAIQAPTFEGTGSIGDRVFLFANDDLVGDTTVGTDATNGSLDDGLGAWEITIDPLDDGEYEIVALIEDPAGNSSVAPAINLTIDTREPNLPLLTLISDTGPSDSDGITNAEPLVFTVTANDTLSGLENPFPNDIKYRIYDRPGDGQGEILVFDSAADGSMSTEGHFDWIAEDLSEGVHNLKLEVEDRAGNLSHPFLLEVTIDRTPPVNTPIRLLPTSDSGMLNDDAVTNVDQPAFNGVSNVGETVYLFANGELVGRGTVGSDSTDGILDDGRGIWEITSEPLVDGRYDFFAQVEDAAGNSVISEPESVIIDTVAPNTPFLDLLTDTGIDTNDNITSVNTPTVSVTANDTVDGGENLRPNDIKYRIYDRTGIEAEVLLVDSFADLGDFTTGGFFEVVLPELADGVHNLKLEVEDRAGNLSHDFLLEITIDTSGPVDLSIDMLRSSDTGMSDTDRVTSIQSPAFTGVGTIGDSVALFANGELVGQGRVAGDQTDGIPDDSRGAWEINSEPLDDGVYEIVAQLEDAAGNFVESDTIRVEIDTLHPNTPFLDLSEEDDTGRHNDDNVTNAELLDFSATTNDANSDVHLELFPDGQNFKYRLFARPESGTEVLLYDSVADDSLTDRLDGLTAQTRIDILDVDLPEGLHNLKMEVEDRAGNVSQHFLLSTLVDRTPPVCSAEIHPESVTSLDGRFTTVRTPSFVGTSEANNVVTLLIDGNPAGTTVSVPFDGDDAFSPPESPDDVIGNWRINTVVPLEDGTHTAVIRCDDPAGNRTTQIPEPIEIDTIGPKIRNVTRLDGVSLFSPKPTSGPDPLINAIVIHFQGEGAAVSTTIAAEEGNYILVGDANGNIPIVDVSVPPPDDSTGVVITEVTLFFVEPLPDDRFTLTVSETISDIAGNHLDGESGANAPFEGNDNLIPTVPIFPTGDDVSGGDFLARFTIDSRAEIGTWGAGSVWIDINGNFHSDPENVDFVNRDIIFKLGFTSDDVFAGNFALRPGDTTDGFHKLAVYGRAQGEFRWLADTDNDGVPNIDRVDPHQVNALPIAGDFDGNTANGDEVGLFDGSTWYFDTNHDFQTDRTLNSFLVGYPIVGDFDGDGFDDLGSYADDTFTIDLAHGRTRGWDGRIDQQISFGFIGVRERPVAGDMDGDGIDDLGLWVPDREGITDRDRSEWYFLVSDGESLLERLSPPDDPINTNPTIDFTPIPFGPDIFARFGDEFARPIVGNFDPPTLGGSPPPTVPISSFHNDEEPIDVSGDGSISGIDALLVINEINNGGSRELTGEKVMVNGMAIFIDVNDDGFLSASDALLVINRINEDARAERGEGENPRAAIDHVDVALRTMEEDFVFWQLQKRNVQNDDLPGMRDLAAVLDSTHRVHNTWTYTSFARDAVPADPSKLDEIWDDEFWL